MCRSKANSPFMKKLLLGDTLRKKGDGEWYYSKKGIEEHYGKSFGKVTKKQILEDIFPAMGRPLRGLTGKSVNDLKKLLLERYLGE